MTHVKTYGNSSLCNMLSIVINNHNNILPIMFNSHNNMLPIMINDHNVTHDNHYNMLAMITISTPIMFTICYYIILWYHHSNTE